LVLFDHTVYTYCSYTQYAVASYYAITFHSLKHRARMVRLSQTRRRIGARDGRPGFEVTALGFGAGTIAGWGDFSTSNTWTDATPNDVDALGAVSTAFNDGVNFFDTAPW